MFIEMKKEGITTYEIIDLLREWCTPHVVQESLTSFWVRFSDILGEQTTLKVTNAARKKHAKVINSIKSYKEVSKYYSANL